MKHSKFIRPALLGLAFMASLFCSSCRTVPFTDRWQFAPMPSNTMLSMSEGEYQKVVKQAKISKNQAETARLNRVGGRIAHAVDQYLAENNIENTFKWEFNLIEDKQVNAWCMPGGKIAVYTGILPLTKDDTGLAVVLGHEVAHALARHGNERVSQGYVMSGFMLGLGLFLGIASDNDPTMGQAILAGTGALVNFGVVLPQSRNNEHEADEIGLILMAKAGYNPEAAVPFWTRMAEAGKGKKPPEFMSTHPGDENRIQFIKDKIPAAMPYYFPSQRPRERQH